MAASNAAFIHGSIRSAVVVRGVRELGTDDMLVAVVHVRGTGAVRAYERSARTRSSDACSTSPVIDDGLAGLHVRTDTQDDVGVRLELGTWDGIDYGPLPPHRQPVRPGRLLDVPGRVDRVHVEAVRAGDQ